MTNSKKHYGVLWALLLMPMLSFAQGSYSLAAIIDSAHQFAPFILQKRALVEASRARVADARHLALPQLRLSEQVSVATDNSLAGSYFSMGITPSTSAGVRRENTTQAESGNMAVLYGEYELYNFGLNRARVQNAGDNANLQAAGMNRDIYFFDADIARLFFNLAKNTGKLNVEAQNIQRYAHIYTVIRAQVLSGLAPGADSSGAMAELSKARINYNVTLQTVEQQKEQLAYYTGIPASRIVVDTTGNLFLKQMPASEYTIDTANNPLISYYNMQAATYASMQKVISRAYMPKLLALGALWARGSSIQYNDQYTDLSNGVNYQRYNYAFGLALTYNLFNPLLRHDKLRINSYLWDAARRELDQQKVAIASASAQADKALQIARSNLEEYPVQLKAAQATYGQKLAQYKAGLISLIDLTNASFVLYRSQIDDLEARMNLYTAELDKATATGNLNSFIQSIK